MEPLGISLGYRLANDLYSPPSFLIYAEMKVSLITCWRPIPSRFPSKWKEELPLLCSRTVLRHRKSHESKSWC